MAEREINAELIAATVEGIADIRASSEGKGRRAVVSAKSANPRGCRPERRRAARYGMDHPHGLSLVQHRPVASHAGPACGRPGRPCRGRSRSTGHGHAGHARPVMALAAALGWASGLRLYAVVFITGLAGLAGWVALPEGLQVLQHPALLVASGFMLFVEFFADKIPGLDSVGTCCTVIRIPRGRTGGGRVRCRWHHHGRCGGAVGGTLAATSQAAKTTARAAINTSPEPFFQRIGQPVRGWAGAGALWLALTSPLVFAGCCVTVPGHVGDDLGLVQIPARGAASHFFPLFLVLRGRHKCSRKS